MEKSFTLDQSGTGDRVVVEGLKCANPHLRNKLLSMGIIPGRILEVSNFAPMGGAMMVRFTDFSLALRLSEARCITVVPF